MFPGQIFFQSHLSHFTDFLPRFHQATPAKQKGETDVTASIIYPVEPYSWLWYKEERTGREKDKDKWEKQTDTY